MRVCVSVVVALTNIHARLHSCVSHFVRPLFRAFLLNIDSTCHSSTLWRLFSSLNSFLDGIEYTSVKLY